MHDIYEMQAIYKDGTTFDCVVIANQGTNFGEVAKEFWIAAVEEKLGVEVTGIAILGTLTEKRFLVLGA